MMKKNIKETRYFINWLWRLQDRSQIQYKFKRGSFKELPTFQIVAAYDFTFKQFI